MKRAFNNERYKDKGHLVDEDTFWSSDVPALSERFQEKPIRLDNNYLYTDETVDRFNAPRDLGERHGQPRGVDPKITIGPVSRFESDMSADDTEKVFVDNLITTFNNEDKIVDQIKKKTGGT